MESDDWLHAGFGGVFELLRGDVSEWPEDLRVREFPAVTR